MDVNQRINKIFTFTVNWQCPIIKTTKLAYFTDLLYSIDRFWNKSFIKNTFDKINKRQNESHNTSIF